MKTRRKMSAMLAAITVAAMVTAGAAQAGGGWVGERQDAQRDRIEAGLASGDLTGREARRLRGEQRRVARLEERLASDGHLSRRDRRRLDRALDRSARRIGRAGHRPGRGHRGRSWPGHQGGDTTVINNHYGTVEPEILETVEPAYSRSVELDLNGVRVIWSASGVL